MARTAARGKADRDKTLTTLRKNCAECGQRMWSDYDNWRTITTLSGTVRLRLKVRRCHNEQCSRHLKPYRPESEGSYGLPQHEFGLDVIALIGGLRYTERSFRTSRLEYLLNSSVRLA